MKKACYLFLFIVFTLLVSLLIHGLVEITTLWLLTNNLDKFGESFVWQHWYTVHLVGGILLWGFGFAAGVWGGLHYWNMLYVEKRFGAPKW